MGEESLKEAGEAGVVSSIQKQIKNFAEDLNINLVFFRENSFLSQLCEDFIEHKVTMEEFKNKITEKEGLGHNFSKFCSSCNHILCVHKGKKGKYNHIKNFIVAFEFWIDCSTNTPAKTIEVRSKEIHKIINSGQDNLEGMVLRKLDEYPAGEVVEAEKIEEIIKKFKNTSSAAKEEYVRSHPEQFIIKKYSGPFSERFYDEYRQIHVDTERCFWTYSQISMKLRVCKNFEELLLMKEELMDLMRHYRIWPVAPPSNLPGLIS